MWNADADIAALELYLEGFGAKRITGQEFENINDKNYIEQQARKQLNMVKPGEIVYIIDGEDEDD